MKTGSAAAGHLSASATALIWGTTFVSTKLLLVDFSPVEILFYRFVIGFVALNLIHPRRLRGVPRRQELLFAAAGLSGVTLYFLLENIALTYTQASNVGVITSITPFLTALLSILFLSGERPRWNFYAGFVAAMAGIALISFSGSQQLQLNPLGDLLAMGASVCWATYTILTRKIGALGYHTIQSTRRVFAYGILFMLLFLPFLPFRFGFGRLARPVNLLNILYLGLGASATCFVTWNFAVRRLGAVRTSVYIYLVPVITIAASMLVLGERITPMGAVGAVLTLAGLVLSDRRGRPRKAQAAQTPGQSPEIEREEQKR